MQPTQQIQSPKAMLKHKYDFDREILDNPYES